MAAYEYFPGARQLRPSRSVPDCSNFKNQVYYGFQPLTSTTTTTTVCLANYQTLSRETKQTNVFLKQIEDAWTPNDEEDLMDAMRGQILRYYRLGQELSHQRHKGKTLSEIRSLDQNLVKKNTESLRANLHSVEDFLGFYYAVDLSGIRNNEEEVCEVRAGIEYLFTFYSNEFWDKAFRKCPTLKSTRDLVTEQFEDWYANERENLQILRPSNLPESLRYS